MNKIKSYLILAAQSLLMTAVMFGPFFYYILFQMKP